MQDLMQRHGLGSKQGTRLLFGGCSAGAIGAMNNLEAVASAMPGNVQTWGFLDGAALLDIKPRGWKWDPELEPLQELMANMSDFTVPQFPSYCATLFPGEEWKCWIGCVCPHARLAARCGRVACARADACAVRLCACAVVAAQAVPHAAHPLCSVFHQRAAV